MCKVLMLTNGSNVDIQKFLNSAAPVLTKTDDDGFGWAAYGKSGVFGEKTLVTANFKTRAFDGTQSFLSRLPNAIRSYEQFGSKDDIVGPVLVHSRTSTNDVNIANTHPICRNDHYIIHNGVVENEGGEYAMLTTNDTEHIVHYLTTQGIEGVENNLSGYYAFGIIDPDGGLHVGKCDTAQLHVTFVSSVDSFMYATTTSIIEKICTEMDWHYEPIAIVADSSYVIHAGNDVTYHQSINPIGVRSSFQRSMMGKSLNRYN